MSTAFSSLCIEGLYETMVLIMPIGSSVSVSAVASTMEDGAYSETKAAFYALYFNISQTIKTFEQSFIVKWKSKNN